MRYFINSRSALSTVNIKDANENIIYKVKSAKKISFGYNVLLQDANGETVYSIKKKGLNSKYVILENDKEILEVKKAMSLIKPKVVISSKMGNFTINGNFYKHKYSISKNNKEIATISKKMINLKNEYFFDSDVENDIEVLFSISVILDNMAYEHEQNLQNDD